MQSRSAGQARGGRLYLTLSVLLLLGLRQLPVASAELPALCHQGTDPIQASQLHREPASAWPVQTGVQLQR